MYWIQPKPYVIWPVSIYPSHDCTPPRTHIYSKHASPNPHCHTCLSLELRTVTDKANINLSLKVGSIFLQNEGQEDSRQDSQMPHGNLAEQCVAK